nr:MAG TPA: hypothetical protein [Caudoviricetes sp.]
MRTRAGGRDTFTDLRKLNIMFVFLSLIQNISIQTKLQSYIISNPLIF